MMTETSPDTEWAVQSRAAALPDDEVHVWLASLDESSSDLRSFLYILAPDEIGRAQRFHFRKDRERFIRARAILRLILGAYLKEHPARLRFSYNSHGKPSLENDNAADDIRFNLSHSNRLALYAVTRGREIGVDIEYIQPGFKETEIAERFFSTAEVAVLRALPLERQSEEFFNCWTRKEAYIKARGEGLSFPLDKFCVSLISGSRRAIVRVQEAPQETSRWSLRVLNPKPDYAATVAAEGQDWKLKCWQYQEHGRLP